MAELVAICEALSFRRVRTYIASGNVVFESAKTAAAVKAALEKRLLAYAGKPVGVVLRTAQEMAAVAAANPFPKAAPNRTVAIFLDEAPPKDALKQASGVAGEEMRLGSREIYVHYGAGMASSKLKTPAAAKGTMRNMNTVAKLAQMAAA
jgi:uncharacterized protein (DUF1697 family)